MPLESALADLDARQMAKWFQGFADVTRLRILDQLIRAAGELPAWDFALEMVRTVSEINHHLRRLCEAGLVLSRQEGRRRVYRLAGPWVADLLRVARESLPMPSQPRRK